MPPRPERSPLRLATRGLVAVLLILAAIPAYLTLAPSWRPVAVRLACAAIVIAACMRLVRGARRSIEAHPTRELASSTPASRMPELDERFLRLRDELVFSVRNRRYFDTILWPQLLRLAGTDLPRPPERRRVRRDGPPLGTLARLIAEVEERA